MRKNVLFISILCLVALSLIMTACNKNEPEQPAQTATYHVSIQAGKGDANQQNGQRQVLGLDGTTLNATWAAGEQVSVRNSTKSADLGGYLVAQSSGALTTLSGELTGTIEIGDALELKFLSPNYTAQQGTLEYISSHCDYATVTIHVATLNGEEITFEEGIADFENKQAVVKFTLKDLTDNAINADELAVEVNSETYTISPASAINVLFVAIPAFTNQTINLTATVGSDTYTYTSPSAKTLANGKYYAITVGMTQQSNVHPFSIDPTHQIEFAHGNLQYNGSTGTWRIARNQYDYVGTYYTAHYYSGYYNRRTDWNAPIGNVYEGGNKCNNTDYYTDLMSTDCWIDQFGWNTWDKPTLTSANKDNYATDQSSFVDWGHNSILDPNSGITYAPDTWRTLTKTEWEYVVWGRPNAEHLCGLASIDGMEHGNVKGLILLPDDFVKPDGITFHYVTDPANICQMSYNGIPAYPTYSGTMEYPNATSDRPDASVFKELLAENLEHEKYLFNQNRYSQAQWEQMESAGAVFLPAAGWAWTLCTDANDKEGTKYRYPFFENFLLAYWSATLSYSEAYYLMINYEEAKVGMATEPVVDGLSIRLVRDL